MIASKLKACTIKDLAALAKRRGVNGWHDMKKDQLVRALSRTAQSRKKAAEARTKPTARKAAASKSVAAKTLGAKKSQPKPAAAAHARNGRKPTVAITRNAIAKARATMAAARIRRINATHDRRKNLATRAAGPGGAPRRDRLVVMVRDAFWLHAYWELRLETIQRAEAAMGQDWHGARPVLRLLDVSSESTTSSAERVLRDVDIHGAANNWYLDVQESLSYRLEIGYLAPSGRFFTLARSNVVATPKAGSSDVVDENWSSVAANFDRIYALSGGYAEAGNSHEIQELFEERLRRPMGSPFGTRYGRGLEGVVNGRKERFEFELDAELLVFGTTQPDAHVTLRGEPVRVRPDGTFTMRFNMPNARMVIPAVAASADGVEQRTIVLAVERNTKVMEPLVRDAND